jgi:NADP-dependent 3-hydroxy acid dehydrogenase YdfG
MEPNSNITGKVVAITDSIARASAFAIEQPADMEIGEVVIRPTAL